MSYLQLALTALSLSFLYIAPCSATSFVALDMRNPEKCVMAYYPEDTKLDILYEMLDPKKDKLSLGVKIDDGPLSQARVTFTIQPSPQSTMAKLPANTLKHELKVTAGKITYKGEGEGKVNVCVRIDEIPGRKYIKPALVSFRIKESGELDDDMTQSPEEAKAQSSAKTHLSDMEKILNKMIRDANLLLKNADLIKNDESGFRKQSEEMNAACRWWPMLHVVVLLVMGFTQANHIVRFFKGKHMI